MDNAVKYFVRFMKQFYAHHSDFRGRDVYIVGQDFYGGKMIPNFMEAIYNIDLPENADEEFTSPHITNKVEKNQKWSEWFNIKGVAIGSPVIDEAETRAQAGKFAEENHLVTAVDGFFLE